MLWSYIYIHVTVLLLVLFYTEAVFNILHVDIKVCTFYNSIVALVVAWCSPDLCLLLLWPLTFESIVFAVIPKVVFTVVCSILSIHDTNPCSSVRAQ